MKTYHKNPRTIKDKQFNDLRAWLLELGDLSGIVHDLNTDEVISGNQRMRAIDVAKCEIVLTEGPHDPDAQGTVAHGYVLWQGAKYNYRQVRWTAEQCEKANIVANKAGGSWDFDILANEWEKDDLLEWGFELEELGMLPDDGAPEDPGAQVDRAAELQELWQTATGQIWAIGEHRLAVGDCTDAAVVARVMGGEKARLVVIDPPYGIGYNRHIPNPKHADLANDDTPQPAFLLSQIPDSEAWYVWSRWDVLAQWADAIPLPVRSVIVWDKQTNGMGDLATTYAPSWEACIFASKPGHKLNGNRDRDVWASPRPESEDHLTPKPIDLICRCVEKSSQPGELVFDGFLGSGTTMVAAQRLGRRCFGIEIDPGYAAVTLQRMSDMGLTPVLTGDNSHA